MEKRLKLSIVAGLSALLLSGSPVFAQHAGKHNAESKAKQADEDVQPTAAGQTAGVDASGKLRPLSNDEAQELVAGIARMVDQSHEGLTTTYHASGAVSLYLDDRFQFVSMARLASDGSVLARCVTSESEARQFLTGKTKVQAMSMPRKVGALVAARPSSTALEEK